MLRLMHVRVCLCIEKVSGTDTFIDAGIICCTLSMYRPLPQLLHSAAQFAADAQSTNINVSTLGTPALSIPGPNTAKCFIP